MANLASANTAGNASHIMHPYMHFGQYIDKLGIARLELLVEGRPGVEPSYHPDLRAAKAIRLPAYIDR